ncbi:MAG TPA: hypothetical protein VMV17_00250 [Streptosporangiaceae bacterium]|nr:hypothetical protein [Streptosporangiaceae bacterium]
MGSLMDTFLQNPLGNPIANKPILEWFPSFGPMQFAAAASTHPTWPAVAVPDTSPRLAVTRRVTGLRRAAARSHGGMVSGGTKMLLMNVSGNSRVKPAVMSIPAVPPRG